MSREMYCFYCNEDVRVNVKEVLSTYIYHNKVFRVKENKCYCFKCNSEIIGDLDERLDKIYSEYKKSIF